jgi:predicted nucleic acid-binding protein
MLGQECHSSLRHASNPVDSFVLGRGQHCQAESPTFDACLTDDILQEVRYNLIKKRMSQEKAESLINVIKVQFTGSFVTNHTLLLTSMPINEQDRHVLAAAVASESQIIVTQNLRDFPPHLLNPFDVEAQSPDDFLVQLFSYESEQMIQIIREQAHGLRNPPRTVPDLLNTLTQHAPTFVTLVQRSLQE